MRVEMVWNRRLEKWFCEQNSDMKGFFVFFLGNELW